MCLVYQFLLICTIMVGFWDIGYRLSTTEGPTLKSTNLSTSSMPGQKQKGIILNSLIWNQLNKVGLRREKRNIFDKMTYRMRRKLSSLFRPKQSSDGNLRFREPVQLMPRATVGEVASEWAWPRGGLPSKAFLAGYQFSGEKIYIGKGYVPDEKSIVPGRIDPAHMSCVEVAWRNWGRCLTKYQVLVGSHYKWVEGRGPVKRPDAVYAGFEDTDSYPYHICRYFMQEENVTNLLLVGKVTTAGYCYAAHNAREYFYTSTYELLVRT